MNRWTPEDGPLEDALRHLPDGHPVTIQWAGSTTTTAQAIRHLGVGGQAIEATWEQPAPAWDGALVILDGVDCPWVRHPDGRYCYTGYLIRTADQLESEYGPCRVLIDADGNYPGTDPCNRGACAAPLGHEGTCAEASGWETTND